MNTQNSPVGLIRKEKIREKLIIENNVIQEAKAAFVREQMDYAIITADPVSDIRRVAKIMYDHDLNCTPMTNEADMFVGIITRTDLVYSVLSNMSWASDNFSCGACRKSPVNGHLCPLPGI